jgi:DNA repair exonuclease SbcCD nuclease subunit
MKTISNINYLVLSDIHLGHKRNETKYIIDNLDKFLFKENDFSYLDMIFIAGDLFDSLLDLSNDDISLSLAWLSRLFHFCHKHNIKLRILEGTPSHDWKQSKEARTVFNILKLPVDFRYVDTLYIEYLKDLELYILYVPDEWTSSTKTTFEQVKVLLKDNNIEQVDIAIMHGLFNYQLNGIVGNIQKHNEADYLNIVKYFINIGHIHTFSNYDRIIAQGSFDRLTHGEEEPKGGVVCTLVENRIDNYFNFIENKSSRIFKTIELKSKDLDACLNKIDKIVIKLPRNSYVRIKAAKDHPVYTAFDQIKSKYFELFFSKTSLEDEEEYLLIKNNIIIDNDYKPLTITKDNIKILLLEQINNKYKFTDKQFDIFNNLLEI